MTKENSLKNVRLTVVLIVIFVLLAGSIFAVGLYTPISGDPEVEQSSTGALRELTSNQTSDIANIVTLQNSFNAVVESVLPSVVEIDVTQTIVRDNSQSFGGLPWFFDDPDSDEYEAESLGSGVIFKRVGDSFYILTNHHVAGEADQIEVVLSDERSYTSQLVGTDSRRDLAIVTFSTEERDIPIAPLGDSTDLKVGDWVLAMGSPFGYFSSVTAGIVSALGRSGRDINNLNDFIQTDASINQGNSGGPLVNIWGEVIGINTWIAAPTGGNIGLGFSIPINNAKEIIEEILEFGRVRDGWLGVSMIDTYEFDLFFEDLGLKDAEGVFVANVYLNSPAYKGGLRPGDLVTEFNSLKVADTEELSRLISNAKIGVTVILSVLRRGEYFELEVVLDERESEDEIENNTGKLWPGVIVQPLDDQSRSSLNLSQKDKGLLLMYMSGISNSNPFYLAGLQNYDVITKINNIQIKSVADFYKAIEDHVLRSYKITYIRNGETKTTLVERQVL
ncbi:MAG: Do family serine endopeptidase [Bacteroidetes bacterium]|nr:Do family serine endopeptidase [Bacteroidota bacterium]